MTATDRMNTRYRPDRRRRTAAGCLRACRPTWPRCGRACNCCTLRGQRWAVSALDVSAGTGLPDSCAFSTSACPRLSWAGGGRRRWPKIGLQAPTRRPSRCWCSSPPTTSTRCRPLTHRRLDYLVKPVHPPAPGGLRAAACSPAAGRAPGQPGCARRRPTTSKPCRPRFSNCARLLGQAAPPPQPRLEVIQAQVGNAGAPGAGRPGAVLRGCRQVRARGHRRTRAPHPAVAARTAAAAGPAASSGRCTAARW